jgi:hypothetical protein
MKDGVPKGIVFDFVEILKDKYGFNYTVKIPQDNVIGDADTGIISMLHKKVRETTQGVDSLLEYILFSRTEVVLILHIIIVIIIY